MIKQSILIKIKTTKMSVNLEDTLSPTSPVKIVRVGVLGGSFDPPTISHLQMASETINKGLADEVWMIPCGARPDKPNLLPAETRLEMLE